MLEAALSQSHGAGQLYSGDYGAIWIVGKEEASSSGAARRSGELFIRKGRKEGVVWVDSKLQLRLPHP